MPLDGQTDAAGTDRAIVVLPCSQEPLSAAAGREGARHKRTVWLKRSGVL